jgi:hypothetical protein
VQFFFPKCVDAWIKQWSTRLGHRADYISGILSRIEARQNKQHSSAQAPTALQPQCKQLRYHVSFFLSLRGVPTYLDRSVLAARCSAVGTSPRLCGHASSHPEPLAKHSAHLSRMCWAYNGRKSPRSFQSASARPERSVQQRYKGGTTISIRSSLCRN